MAHRVQITTVMMTSQRPRTFTPTDFQNALAAAQERAAKLESDARTDRLALEKLVRLARGTSDLAERAADARGDTLARRLEIVLRGPKAPISLVALASAVKEPAERVRKELRKLHNTLCPTRSIDDAEDARLVYNHGTDDAPVWQWVIGDETPTELLVFAVEEMLRRRAYTFAELTLATGARRGRLSGVIVRFQRAGWPIFNDGGSEREYRWRLGPQRLKR